MKKIQETLDALQPYVIGIRYAEGIPLVDVVFKEGWTIPDDSKIQKAKGEESMNYYMLFSEVPNVGLDDLLNYVERTIKLNLEREKKHDLLRAKVDELKQIFKSNTLAKLKHLKFIFGDEDLTPNINEFDLDISEPLEPETAPNEVYEEEFVPEAEPQTEAPVTYLDENRNPIQLTEDELEMIEEEARAERNRKILENRNNKDTSKLVKKASKVELPPKPKTEVLVMEAEKKDCLCGPDEYCSQCIDDKGY